jgi:hypothetical protein
MIPSKGKDQMNFNRVVIVQQIIAILNIALLLTIGPGGAGIATAQQGDAAPPPKMSPDQLDQLVSSIALYPDPLLAQVLVGATFPTDVVQADRWAKQNKNLKGQQLTDAVVKANLPYDPSIVALIQFPTVLDMLSQKLDWTTSLGNAVLTQRGDVMDAVQRMRRKAEKMGNLKSSDQVKVVSNTTVIEIQPAKPEVIYVPVYNPQVIYVQPAPPPPPPGPSTGAVVATGLLAFGVGVAVGAAASNNSCCWYGGSMAWSSHTVVVANTSYNRTWATRGAIPPPPPYYRPGGPYPAGRPPVPAYGNTAYGNTVNRNVNNVNNVTINTGNTNVNTGNKNTANVNNSTRNTATTNNATRNTANTNNATRNASNPSANAATAGDRNTAATQGANRSSAGAASGNRGYSQPSSTSSSSAFSGAQNGRSEKAASQRGQATRGSRQR